MNTTKLEQLGAHWVRLRALPSPMDFEGDYRYVKRAANGAPSQGSEKTPSNPSRKASLRVSNPLPTPTSCNICGEPAVRVGTHAEIYGREYGEWPYVYLCECCGSYVGLHPFTDIPLGTLADFKTRSARKTCKGPFERLHKTGGLSRDQAYAWLAKAMKIPIAECHFGWFTYEQCNEAKALCLQKLKQIR